MFGGIGGGGEGGMGRQVNYFGGKLTYMISFRSPPPPTSPLAESQGLRPQSGNTGSSRWDNR